ncbi:MAG: hypothetical protein GY754_26060 [bacterium]|nr:hypothetical protein [bacterium]
MQALIIVISISIFIPLYVAFLHWHSNEEMRIPLRYKRNNKLNRLFSLPGEALNLSHFRGNSVSSPFLNGMIKGHEVSVKLQSGMNKGYIQMSVKHRRKFKKTFSVDKETTLTRMNKIIGVDDILIGDNLFDEKMQIQAEEQFHIILFFNNEVRAIILELERKMSGLEITHSGIKMVLAISWANAELMISSIESALAISRNIYETHKKGVKKTFIHNLKVEETPSVLIKNIRFAAKFYPRNKTIIPVFNKLAAHLNPEVRFEAACHTGPERFEHIYSLLESYTELSEELLLKVIEYHKENPYEKCIPLLQEILKNTSNLEIQLRIIETLGQCGGIEQIEQLHALPKKSLNLTISSAVRKAIEQIQSRLGDVEKGWLSVEDPVETDGALSMMIEAEEGSLSLHKEKSEELK